MGQYSVHKEEKEEFIEHEAVSRRDSRHLNKKVYRIRIPKKIIKELKERFNEEYYKVILEGPTHLTYYLKLKNKSSEVFISVAGLSDGIYRLKFYPYRLEDFLEEYNSFIKKKYPSLNLGVKNGRLILRIGKHKLETERWSFQKIFGGGIGIIAEYKSEFGHPKIIYKIRNNKAEIKLATMPLTNKTKGYKIIKLDPSELGIRITYKASRNKIKRAYINLKEFESIKSFHMDPSSLNIKLIRKGSKYDVFEFTPSEEAVIVVESILLDSFISNERGDRYPADMEKGDLGVKIAKAFLTKQGYNVITDQSKIKKIIGGRTKRVPDVVIMKLNNQWIVYEVKFIMYAEYINKIYRKAIRQVRDQIKDLRKLGINVPKYGVIIIYYRFDISLGLIFFKEYLSDEDEKQI